MNNTKLFFSIVLKSFLRYSISMKVVDIKSISKEDGYIYYINKYKATAVLEILSQEVSIPVSFSIEISPFGKKTIEVDALPDDAKELKH